MNRRSIFKLFAGAVCAAAIEVTGLKPIELPSQVMVINPEYITAAYEAVYYSFDGKVLCNPTMQSPLFSEDAPRYDLINGQWVQREKFIAQNKISV